MTRVSADLSPERWGGLDRYAEQHGMTRSEAVAHAVDLMLDEEMSFILGAGQMLAVHPALGAVGAGEGGRS